MNVLQIGSSVDIAALKAGMEEAAGTVRSGAGQMSAQFQALAGESKQSVTQISSNWVQAAQASLSLKAAQSDVRSATRAAKEAEDDDTAALAKLALAKRQAAAAADVMRQAEKQAIGETRGLGEQSLSSSLLVRGLGQDLGIGIPRFAATFIGSIGGVRDILMAGFPAFAVVALGEAIVKIIPKVQELIDNLRQLSQVNEIIAGVNKIRLGLLETMSAHRQAAEIGTEGMRRTSMAVQNAAKDVDQYHRALRGHGEIQGEEQKLEQLQERLRKFHEAAADPIAAAQYAKSGELPVFQTEYEVKKAEEAAKRQEAVVDELKSKFIASGRELERARAEQRSEAEKEGEAGSRAEIDAEKKKSLEMLATREASVKEFRALGKISAQDELDDLNTLSDLKLQAEQRYITRMRALLNQEHAATGRNVAPELTSLDSESTSVTDKNQAEKSANQARFDEEEKRRAREVAIAKIDAAAAAADAQVRLDDQTARESYAAHKASSQQETNLLLTAEKERYDAHVAKLQAQLAEDLKEPEKYAAQIITINSQIQTAEKDHQAKMAEIRAEGTRKAIEDGRRAAEEESNATVRAAERQLESTLRIDNERLKHHQMTVGQWATDEIAAVDKAERAEVDAMELQLSKLRELGLQETTEYKAIQDREVQIKRQAEQQKQQIDQVELDHYTQMAQRMTQVWTRGLTQVLFQHETVTKMIGQVYEEMVSKVIQSLGQWVAAEVVALIQHKALAEQGIVSDAASAAASAFRWVMNDVPFPVNAVLAPVAAAGAFAGVMAFGSFEHGGVVPGAPGEPRMILAHGQEMYLGTELSQRVQNLSGAGGAGSSGGGGRGGHRFNVNYQPVINHSVSRDDLRDHAEFMFGEMRRLAYSFNT